MAYVTRFNLMLRNKYKQVSTVTDANLVGASNELTHALLLPTLLTSSLPLLEFLSVWPKSRTFPVWSARRFIAACLPMLKPRFSLEARWLPTLQTHLSIRCFRFSQGLFHLRL